MRGRKEQRSNQKDRENTKKHLTSTYILTNQTGLQFGYSRTK